jgi:hypothetical protein
MLGRWKGGGGGGMPPVAFTAMHYYYVRSALAGWLPNNTAGRCCCAHIIISRTYGEAHDGLLGHRGVEDTVSTVRGPCAVLQVCSISSMQRAGRRAV